jgi:glycosyltransferase involved in cell wall biosynthesis
MRILHAPSDVGGHAYQLSRAERSLGLESDVVVFGPSALGYGADRVVWVEGMSTPRRLVRRAGFLREAVHRYDVFHFNFGQPILALRAGGRVFNELAWLKRRGKTILVTFQGCDVRPQERCVGCTREDCARETPYRAPNAAAMLRHADRGFYLNPDLRDLLPGARFLPYGNVDLEAVRPAPFRESREIVVAHAPTHREIKGTEHLLGAVNALQSEGLSVRLDLLEGLQREEVLARTAAADVVVDQLLAGWYGGFAVEGMALGKPVLAYMDERNPFGDRLPIVRTGTATIADDLRRLVADPEARKEAGAAGRRFVEEHHDPVTVARSVLDGVVPLPSRPRGEAETASVPG